MSELFWGIITILLQGLFAGTETAYTKAHWVRLLTYAQNPKINPLIKKGAYTAQLLINHKEQVLVITLIFTNIFTVLSSVLFTKFFVHYFGSWAASLAIIFAATLSITIGDFFPKILAQAVAEYWAIATAPLIKIFKFLAHLYPFAKTSQTFTTSRDDFLRLLEQKKEPEIILVSKIAKAFFGFSQLTIEEILVPKEKIIAFHEDDSLKIVKKIISNFRYSRYPVYCSQNDKIIGIVHIKDIIYATKSRHFTLRKILRPPYRIKPHTKATVVLQEMALRGEHLAIVENEAGQLLGIVTLEDLLEELIGEIRSEA
ncbi:MAG: CNNM domain-containing protein [candidate division WOR-3 bacterium]|nr:CNNM domain-containing protein [candidate division WOR-3 bacterium]MCX7756697.1 CNNM domain-containing protein [candidate division WOR-3 bacterium]MDW7987872.1 CNNM domain-containing protein [candidate division WOR-3 bacterium]